MKLRLKITRWAAVLFLGFLSVLAVPGRTQDNNAVYQVGSITGTVYWKRSRMEKSYRLLDPKQLADRNRKFYGGERLTCVKGSQLLLKKVHHPDAGRLLEGPLIDWPVPYLAPSNNDVGALRTSNKMGRDTASRVPDKQGPMGFPLKQADVETSANDMKHAGPGHVMTPVPAKKSRQRSRHSRQHHRVSKRRKPS